MKIYILTLFISLSITALNAQSIENNLLTGFEQSQNNKPQMVASLNIITKTLEVKLPNLDGGGSVSIFNGDGQLVISVFPEKNTLNIDVSKLKKGGYLVVYGELQCKFQMK